ncbi:MAG TPA: hypothetical protein PLX89_01720 [Verrucomicrobiota bacterium]|nr:hypothetical protein [Verrucomicrobiales bacterium]HRI11695.1 hypothetical protein [Verrucomicrobiota bacterium]
MKTSCSHFYAALVFGAALHCVALGDAASPVNYQAHEWGTFTSVQAADGTPLSWNPFTRTDLPKFVYERRRPFPESILGRNRLGFEMFSTKDSRSWLQRMETPVIYFHTDRPITLRARVGFPKGLITEWFPQAAAFGPVFGVENVLPDSRESFLEWPSVTISPDNDRPRVPLPQDSKASHYYAARNVQAARVTIPSSGRDTSESDRFLFYRGAGNFSTPLRVSMASGRELIVENTGSHPLSGLQVIEARSDRAYRHRIPELRPGESLHLTLPDVSSFAARTTTTKDLARSLEHDLAVAGLRGDEAAAMVATWRDAWFDEDGLRILYLLPREWTDGILPLELTPAPTELVRVMVGRAEVFSPDEEHLARTAFAKFRSGRNVQALLQGFEAVNPRFREPLLARVGEIEAKWLVTANLFSCSGIPMTRHTEDSLQKDLQTAHQILLRNSQGGRDVTTASKSRGDLAIDPSPILSDRSTRLVQPQLTLNQPPK